MRTLIAGIAVMFLRHFQETLIPNPGPVDIFAGFMGAFLISAGVSFCILQDIREIKKASLLGKE